jgi:putative hemolysin
MMNPSAVYCDALGYEYEIVQTPEGEVGQCQVAADKTADAWNFLEGKEAPEYSYCSKSGYALKVVTDRTICARFMTEQCAVCVKEDGTEVEVTELMGLSFEETTCGDGTCGLPETYATCPQDCPSGSADGICDKAADGICDEDCVMLNITGDPDCKQAEQPSSCLPLLTLSLTGIAAIILRIL